MSSPACLWKLWLHLIWTEDIMTLTWIWLLAPQWSHETFKIIVLFRGDSVDGSISLSSVVMLPCVLTCQTQTPLQRQKTKARCADRDAWPPPRPTRATATQPSSTGLIASSRVRQPHRPRHPPRPTREGGLFQTPLHTQLWMPTPPPPLWQTWWHTPSSVSNPKEPPHVTFWLDYFVCMFLY